MTLLSDIYKNFCIQARLRMITSDDISFTSTSTITSGGKVDFNEYFDVGETISVRVDDGVGTNDGDYTVATITTVTNPGDTITTTETTIVTDLDDKKVTVSSPRSRTFADPADTFQDLDFALSYYARSDCGWSYDDTTKVFSYDIDYPKSHTLNWGISVAADGSPAGEIMEIGIKVSKDGGLTYNVIEESRSYREFEGLTVGYFSSSFRYVVEVGDKFKMNVRVNGGLSIVIENLTMSFHSDSPVL